jgi:Putative RNA methylase family UPF0020
MDKQIQHNMPNSRVRVIDLRARQGSIFVEIICAIASGSTSSASSLASSSGIVPPFRNHNSEPSNCENFTRTAAGCANSRKRTGLTPAAHWRRRGARYAVLTPVPSWSNGPTWPATGCCAAARENIGPRYKPIELREWDAVALPIGDGEVTRIITNLPWGRKWGSHPENRRLYPRLMREFRRVLAPGGLMVLMTSETRLMRELLEEHEIAPNSMLAVTVLGASAWIYVCRVGHR